MEYGKIKEAAQQYLPAMTKFLRELIRIPGESCQEEGHIRRIAKEMEDVGFDKVVIDGLGNVLGYMGSGSKIIAYVLPLVARPSVTLGQYKRPVCPG